MNEDSCRWEVDMSPVCWALGKSLSYMFVFFFATTSFSTSSSQYYFISRLAHVCASTNLLKFKHNFVKKRHKNESEIKLDTKTCPKSLLKNKKNYGYEIIACPVMTMSESINLFLKLTLFQRLPNWI